MLLFSTTAQHKLGEKPARACAVLPCPVCNGGMSLERAEWKCPRCLFRICEGCEGAIANEVSEIQAETV